jgi:hypothetical protein
MAAALDFNAFALIDMENSVWAAIQLFERNWQLFKVSWAYLDDGLRLKSLELDWNPKVKIFF